MNKIDTSELVDIFKEEMNKKTKKEVKRQKKLEKKMERQEDIAFEKITKEEEKKQEEKKRQQELLKKKNRESSPSPLESTSNTSPFFYNVLLGFFLILLLLCTCGYSAFLLHTSLGKKNGIKCLLLITSVIFYILSFITKKQSTKKICAVISSMMVSVLMIFLIYIA